jgi:CheY-like chemotaxis protein
MTECAPILILEEEENKKDVLLLKQSLDIYGLPHPLKIVHGAEHLVHYLEGTGVYHDRRLHPWPGLILLDLDFPRKSGLDILSWRRTRPRIRRIPVIVLSSSRQTRHVNRAYELGANSYLIKPSEPGFLLDYMGTIIQYWLQFNQIPDP